MCELLTTAEIEEALGRPVVTEIAATIDCRYTIIDTLDTTEVSVSIVRPAAAAESFEQDVAASIEPGDTTQRIDRLGDSAVLITTADLSVLSVTIGDTRLTLGMPRRDGAGETLSRLAGLALRRVP